LNNGRAGYYQSEAGKETCHISSGVGTIQGRVSLFILEAGASWVKFLWGKFPPLCELFYICQVITANACATFKKTKINYHFFEKNLNMYIFMKKYIKQE
jgi:hypothetical protein